MRRDHLWPHTHCRERILLAPTPSNRAVKHRLLAVSNRAVKHRLLALTCAYLRGAWQVGDTKRSSPAHSQRLRTHAQKRLQTRQAVVKSALNNSCGE
eukprot:6190209-Pleurochrysis_carterae.AAC.2